MRGSRRGGPVAALGTKDGHNRYVWDLRHSGADGPMVAPGEYQVRVTAGSWSDTKPLEVKIDRRVTADGVTQADLEEQTALLLKVRDAMSEARALSAMVRDSRKDFYDKLVTAEGPYPQPMLIDQLSNIARMVGQADQKNREGSADPVRRCDEGAGADQGGREVESVAGILGSLIVFGLWL